MCGVLRMFSRFPADCPILLVVTMLDVITVSIHASFLAYSCTTGSQGFPAYTNLANVRVKFNTYYNINYHYLCLTKWYHCLP